jgi:hypothetical protein
MSNIHHRGILSPSQVVFSEVGISSAAISQSHAKGCLLRWSILEISAETRLKQLEIIL